MGKIIGIISLKGGVGKTTVVSSLGAALSEEFQKKVLIVDANFSAPNLALHVGLINPKMTIHHVLEAENIDIKHAIYKTEHGVHIIPGALLYKKVEPLKLKEQLKKISADYDVVLIDSSPSLNEEILATMMASDDIFVVTTPDHVTLSTTLLAVRLAKQKETPITGLILNKVHNKQFELSLSEIEETSNCNVLAVIPHEMHVLEALSKNIPSTIHKDTKGTKEYKRLAAAILNLNYKDGFFKSVFQRILQKTPKQEVNRTLFRESR